VIVRKKKLIFVKAMLA